MTVSLKKRKQTLSLFFLSFLRFIQIHLPGFFFFFQGGNGGERKQKHSEQIGKFRANDRKIK